MSWTIVEDVLHRWVRESTGLGGASVSWPAKGLALRDPPSVELSVIGDLDFTIPGNAEKRSAQNVSWQATVLAGPGTHSLDVLTSSSATAVDSTSVTMPGGTTVTEARDALLAQATSDLADLTVAASGTDAITITGTSALPVFHLDESATLSLLLLVGPAQVLRVTASQVVISASFRSTAVSGSGTARLLAAAAKDGMRDFDRLLRRCGYRFGAVLRDTPGYADDLTESRHVLDVQLLGHRVSERAAKPWVRKTKATFTAAGITTTVIKPE